ncbi:phage tail protein [Burkholderia territorii]|uniref:tail fiber assembly protein n=1 Tax=Burkholderia territorii TaxID=1503055 RepID=UPI00075339C7|nr:tail fiber assembly protein [Burkholderia territorii]KUY95479.1 phage tail protein [Burkholderia territorii]KUZ05637.1 phage tail protein [Burkholderia territorii]
MNGNLVHQYDRETGQYLSSILPDPDPQNPDRWIVPAFSTADPLPTCPRRKWPFRRGDTWALLPDFRGVKLYRKSDGMPSEIFAAGIAPDDAELTESPRPSSEHVWNGTAWVVDEAVVAKRIYDEAMAEFNRRMDHARDMNQGKADAYAAGQLSREERYYFRAWSAYQLDMVRAINAKGFPHTVTWPQEPASFEVACGPVMTDYAARMAKAKEITDGMADAHKGGMLSDEETRIYEAWTEYARRLTQAIDGDKFPNNVVWPDEPAKHEPAAADEPNAPDDAAQAPDADDPL